jgi:hypothetical protein
MIWKSLTHTVREIQISKLTKQSTRCFVVSDSGLNVGCEKTNGYAGATILDVGPVLAARNKVYALEFPTFPRADVTAVLLWGAQANIRTPIIKTAPIDMVNLHIGRRIEDLAVHENLRSTPRSGADDIDGTVLLLRDPPSAIFNEGFICFVNQRDTAARQQRHFNDAPNWGAVFW